MLSLIQTNIILEILFADGSAGEMVNPAKTAAQVNAESMEGKDLYKFSHSDYEVGKSKIIVLLYKIIKIKIIILLYKILSDQSE